MAILKVRIEREVELDEPIEDLFWLGELLRTAFGKSRGQGGLDVQVNQLETSNDFWYFEVQVTR